MVEWKNLDTVKAYDKLLELWNDVDVKEVMSGKVYVGRPDMEVALAAGLMGREQIRRLPVMENGRLCGMVSLGDMARKEESSIEASDALAEISSHLSSRE